MSSPNPSPLRGRASPMAARPSDLLPPSDHALLAIQALHDASDPFDLLAALFQANRAFGVRASACVHVVPDPERSTQVLASLACDAQPLWACAPTGSWLDHPWLQHARGHAEAVPASMLEAPTSGADDEPAPRHSTDLESILIVPTHSGGGTGRFGALIVDGTPQRTSPRMPADSLRLLVHSLANELHEWWLRHTRDELQHRARLRSEDLKLLGWERQGLSTKQIARLASTSVAAVDSRFQRINAKMGNSHRRHAALRAAIHGLL